MYLAETTVVRRRESLLHQADLDAPLIFLNVREIAQAGAFDHIGTGCHGTAKCILHAVALGEPNGQEGRKRRVAGAHRGTDLDLEGAVGKPDVLAVREVRTRSTQGEQDILRPAGMQLGHGGGNGFLVAGMDVVDKIASVPTDWNDKPKTPVKMKTVELIEG